MTHATGMYAWQASRMHHVNNKILKMKLRQLKQTLCSTIYNYIAIQNKDWLKTNTTKILDWLLIKVKSKLSVKPLLCNFGMVTKLQSKAWIVHNISMDCQVTLRPLHCWSRAHINSICFAVFIWCEQNLIGGVKILNLLQLHLVRLKTSVSVSLRCRSMQ